MPQAVLNWRRPKTRLRNRTKYQYDGLQRLTAAEWKDSGGGSLYAYEYQYDKVGNRTRLGYNGTYTYYTYNAANELLSEFTPGGDTTYYSYDGRGNQVQREFVGGDTTYFSYNSRDLVTRIDSTEGGFTPNTFEYNAQGQRTRITNSTGTTYFVWDGIRITHEHDGLGNVTKRYTYGHSPIVGVSDLIDLQHLDGGTDPHYFYHFDQVGGIHRLTDASETLAQTLEFSPFGRMLVETGSAPNPFAFPATYVRSGERDGDMYSPTRVWSALSGRFSGRDPLQVSSSVTTRYAYPVAAIDSTDPTGLCPSGFKPMDKAKQTQYGVRAEGAQLTDHDLSQQFPQIDDRPQSVKLGNFTVSRSKLDCTLRRRCYRSTEREIGVISESTGKWRLLKILSVPNPVEPLIPLFIRDTAFRTRVQKKVDVVNEYDCKACMELAVGPDVVSTQRDTPITKYEYVGTYTSEREGFRSVREQGRGFIGHTSFGLHFIEDPDHQEYGMEWDWWENGSAPSSGIHSPIHGPSKTNSPLPKPTGPRRQRR